MRPIAASAAVLIAVSVGDVESRQASPLGRLKAGTGTVDIPPKCSDRVVAIDSTTVDLIRSVEVER